MFRGKWLSTNWITAIEGKTTFLEVTFITFVFICMFPFNQYIILFVFLRFMTFRKTQDGKMKEATKSRVEGKSYYIHDELSPFRFAFYTVKIFIKR